MEQTLAEWARVRDEDFENDQPEEWDGVIPDPYPALDKFGKVFLATYLQHLDDIVGGIANDGNPEYDMNFKMKCSECDKGWCDVTLGFEMCWCTMGDNERKDGFYVGEF